MPQRCLTNIFILLAFFMITHSWAMDTSDEESELSLVHHMDFGKNDQDMTLATVTLPQQNELSEEKVEEYDNILTAFPNEIFKPFLLYFAKTDEISIGHLFRVSKSLNEKMSELFPICFLSWKPFIPGILWFTDYVHNVCNVS